MEKAIVASMALVLSCASISFAWENQNGGHRQHRPDTMQPQTNGGATDNRGGHYAPAAGGVIDTRDGTFHQGVAGGYVNTKTGQFVPAQ